jgi:hypothetical protein
MRHLRHTVVGAVVLLALSTAATSLPVVAETPEPAATVSVADIGTKVSLVGRLGQPLGKMMTIRGKWVKPSNFPKPGAFLFIVSHVNGKQLTQPVEFDIGQMEVVMPNGKNALPDFKRQAELDGVVWTLRAYETGRFSTTPEEYWTERGSGPRALPYWTRDFTSELVGIVQHEPRSR